MNVRLLPALLLLFVVWGDRALAADAVSVPRAEGLALDGRLAEPAWATAARLPVGTAKVPPRRGEEAAAAAELTPVVRALAADGCLWLGVEIPEDVGLGTGVKGMIALPGTKTAADAFEFAYMPQDVRNPRYVARGARGIGRATYRLRGALDLAERSTSRIEIAIPFADLGLPAPDAPLRLALAVGTRTPAALAWSPPSATFASPDQWLPLTPPDGGWPSGESIDAAQISAEDRKDEARMAAWRKFLEGRGRAIPPGTPEATMEAVRANLLNPLDEVLANRPDLAYAHAIKADVYRQLGKDDEALEEVRLALVSVPGLREALLPWLGAFASKHAEGTAEQPSDYAGAFARLDAAAAGLTDPYQKDGADLARGLLLLKRGDFDEARALLRPLADRYPFLPIAVTSAEHAEKYAKDWVSEMRMRERDEKKGDLPWARIVTAKGAIVVELFEDDAPNTVRNFVWLAQKRFFDGSLFHRNVPFFVAQGGDPFSKDPATRSRAGTGGPCYAIRTEAGARKPFRGTLAMARSTQKNTEGSQFFVLTGTAAHLEGDYSVFGRVREGQDVAEKLVQGDEIRTVEILRTRPGVEYRPKTTAGAPAPEPRPCGPAGR